MRVSKRYIPVIIVLFLILLLTLQSPDETLFLSGRIQNMCKAIAPNISGRWATDMHWFRTLLHIPMYFVLGAIVSLSVSHLYTAICFCGITAIADETFKIFLPTREFGLMDLIFDAIGFLIGIGIVTLIKRIKKN